MMDETWGDLTLSNPEMAKAYLGCPHSTARHTLTRGSTLLREDCSESLALAATSKMWALLPVIGKHQPSYEQRKPLPKDFGSKPLHRNSI